MTPKILMAATTILFGISAFAQPFTGTTNPTPGADTTMGQDHMPPGSDPENADTHAGGAITRHEEQNTSNKTKHKDRKPKKLKDNNHQDARKVPTDTKPSTKSDSEQ